MAEQRDTSCSVAENHTGRTRFVSGPKTLSCEGFMQIIRRPKDKITAVDHIPQY